MDEKGELAGFNVSIGGGMGVTHANKKTYPRAGDVIGFCTPEQGKYVAEAIMLTQRDNGNRAESVFCVECKYLNLTFCSPQPKERSSQIYNRPYGP
jgi:hypothetical protein